MLNSSRKINMLHLRRSYSQLKSYVRVTGSLQKRKIINESCKYLKEVFDYTRNGNYFSTGICVKNLPNVNHLNSMISSSETANDVLEIVNKHLCNFQNDNIVKCVEMLETIMFKTVCETYPWAISESETMLYVQTIISNDCQRLFSQVVETETMQYLFKEIIANISKFSDKKLVNLAQSLVRLQVKPSSDVIVAICTECITRSSTFELHNLYPFATVANHFGRSGFYLMGLIVNKFSEHMNNTEMNAENYNIIGRVLGRVNYFCSADMIRGIVLNFSANGKLIFSSEELEKIDPISTLYILESLSTFGKITDNTNGKLIAPLIWHLEKFTEKLTLYQLAKVKKFSNQPKYKNYKLIKAVKTRAQTMLYSQNLKPIDINSLLSIFDNESKEITKKLEKLIIENIHKFDSLTLSSLSRQTLLFRTNNLNLITAYSDQVVKCLPDLDNSITCLQRVASAFLKLKTCSTELDHHLSAHCLQKLEQLIPIHNSQIFSTYLLRRSVNFGFISPILLNTLANQIPQFSTDYLLGIKECIENSKHFMKFPNRIVKLVRSALIDRLQAASTLGSLNLILNKCTVHTLCNYCPEISECIAEKYLMFLPQITQDNLYLTSSNIRQFKIYLPEVLQKFVDVVIEKQDNIYSKVYLDLLKTLSAFNYVPNEVDNLETIFVNLMSKSAYEISVYDFISGLLNLSTLGSYSESLLKKVFSFSYLKKVDQYCEDEVKQSKELLKLLAMLNRSTILHRPELNIPWFNEDIQKYSRIILTVDTRRAVLKWKNDVEQQLISIFGAKNLNRQNVVYSDYHHAFDFELYLDDRNNATSKNSNEWTTKVAIIILTPSNFCTNIRHILGSVASVIDELEILEYKVVTIPYYDLDSMHLSDESTLTAYLKQKIFGNNSFS